MSYNIGQIRRNQIDSYFTNIQFDPPEYFENNNYGDDIISFIFQDVKIKLDNLSSEHSYYLKFKVKQKNTQNQNFTIKLQNNLVVESNIQTLNNFSVKINPKEEESKYDIFEFIFTPNGTYNEVIFELNRTGADFLIINDDGTTGRKMEIEIIDFYIVNNIISNYLAEAFNLNYLTKIGIQGPPGLLFVLDGEEIHLGKTGIYEIYNENITINYLGFIIGESTQTPDGKDFFILDFKY